ncbi:two-component sensor histidine kinase [Actinoplanes lobatus]|uniref:histidine kinase n=1 Tax=Actinoplanes lobatus TaxID=113568 RepID=A0A7W7HN68_9ACTN|nr:HAMP domain-containing sensor histidine kinase [Actinoplanes lobatus]MBB4753642.1 signal transduction histidine kinase [Actinoplanes lobatus]GGN84356.1 two-component sensor histidine kinase [Actinoplanes lobatus]GIE38179.1 two-component sensor histidine kinase [Actinoplanes lobatus]
MRRRLVVTYLLLLCMVLLALAIPLAVTVASRETDRAVADRLADATRFASLAAPAVRSGELDALTDELRRYQELYGIGTMLVDQDQRVLSVFGSRPADPAGAIRGALAGHQVGSPETLWPWTTEPLVVAVPVSDGGAVLGVVLTVSPTDRNRRAVLVVWLVLAMVGAIAVAACLTTAHRLAGWVLRPVTRLDAAAHEIAAGDSAARVQPGLGPPELRRLSASFNEMADAVAEAMERQRSFVAHASHQLRNPLTVLRLRIEDLGGGLDDEDLRADHEIALEETDRLADVLDGLLALARAERGQQRVEVVDAVALTRNRVQAWRPLTERRDIELVAVLPEERLPARMVATALDQALDALIDNALKFTPAGGKVEVEVAAREGGAEVTVRDTGPGMTEEQRRRAAERFWRAPDAQNVDGAGLGLSIVAVLVEASGGRFTLAPAATGGLAATIWFTS